MTGRPCAKLKLVIVTPCSNGELMCYQLLTARIVSSQRRSKADTNLP